MNLIKKILLLTCFSLNICILHSSLNKKHSKIKTVTKKIKKSKKIFSEDKGNYIEKDFKLFNEVTKKKKIKKLSDNKLKLKHNNEDINTVIDKGVSFTLEKTYYSFFSSAESNKYNFNYKLELQELNERVDNSLVVINSVIEYNKKIIINNFLNFN